MKITIIAEDRLVGVDGMFVTVPELTLDIEGDPDPRKIHAVQFDTSEEWGEIEYRQVSGEPGKRPYKPSNDPLGPEEFKDRFAHLIEKHAELLKQEAVQ